MGPVFLTGVTVVALAGAAAFAQQQADEPREQSADRAEQQAASGGECAARMDEVAGGEFFAGPDARYRQHPGALASLRDAAVQLQAENLEAACLQVVAAMQTAIAEYQAASPSEARAARGDVSREQLDQRLVPVDASAMPLNTAELQGSDLYNLDGEDIGDVEGILMSHGRPTHIIVAHNGFWSIGDEDAAIPLDIVLWDPEWQSFFAPLTGDDLDNAPRYDESAWDTGANDAFYQPFRG